MCNCIHIYRLNLGTYSCRHRRNDEKVDKAAKPAPHLPCISNSCLLSNFDLFLYINNVIHQQWFTEWKINLLIQGNKLTQLKEKLIQWQSPNQPTRPQEIVLTNLQIRHTRLTHTHLITHLLSLSCPHCNNDLLLTIDHLFNCSLLASIRDLYNVTHDPITALTAHFTSLANVLSHLRHTNFLSQI